VAFRSGRTSGRAPAPVEDDYYDQDRYEEEEAAPPVASYARKPSARPAPAAAPRGACGKGSVDVLQPHTLCCWVDASRSGVWQLRTSRAWAGACLLCVALTVHVGWVGVPRSCVSFFGGWLFGAAWILSVIHVLALEHGG
jgi:hypothetical protein